jgi:hypothetical protein
MSAINGHAATSEVAINQTKTVPIATEKPKNSRRRRLSEKSKAMLLEELQIPFDPSLVKWRSHKTQTVHRRVQGFVLPYADPRAYKDRLNLLLTPIGWTDTYDVTSTPQKIVVRCQLSIPDLGVHSATGEEWANKEYAATSAEAQAFKRACACFGLGRYLYYFEGAWLLLDRQNRPTSTPALPEWATPEGWRQGLRPAPRRNEPAATAPRDNGQNRTSEFQAQAGARGKNVVQQILAMERTLGSSLYRGLLKSLAKAWNPTEIREISLQHKVLLHMQGALRGLKRVGIAREKLSESVVSEIFRSLDLNAVSEIRDLDTLKKLVISLERAAGIIS